MIISKDQSGVTIFQMVKSAKAIFYIAAITLASLFAISSANAVVVGGSITGGSALGLGGVFEKLSTPFIAPFPGLGNPDSSVGEDNFQSPNLYAFDEDQNILLPNILLVNEGSDVPALEFVASHYVFFDPDGTSLTTIEGFVDFDAQIIGVATSTALLDASDVLQNGLVNYLSPGLRGLESGDSVSIVDATGLGFLVGNKQRLEINWAASTPGDFVRVFTQFSPTASVVPLPAALPLYGTGLAIMGFIGWRRKQRNAA